MKKKKVVLFAFRDDLPCFIHVLLNAIEMHEKGYEAKIVLEGASVKLVALLADEANHMHKLFESTKELGLFAGACRACSHMMGATAAVEKEKLTLLDDMHGHPGMHGFIEAGFTVLTF